MPSLTLVTWHVYMLLLQAGILSYLHLWWCRIDVFVWCCINLFVSIVTTFCVVHVLISTLNNNCLLLVTGEHLQIIIANILFFFVSMNAAKIFRTLDCFFKTVKDEYAMEGPISAFPIFMKTWTDKLECRHVQKKKKTVVSTICFHILQLHVEPRFAFKHSVYSELVLWSVASLHSTIISEYHIHTCI